MKTVFRELVPSDQWATPDLMFQDWHERFDFTLDAAATAENKKLERYCIDGLSDSWAGERVWINPPYSDPLPWCRRAYEETASGNCPLVVMLLRVDTSTAWFHDWLLGKAEIEWLRRRIRFVGATGSPNFASMLAIYRSK